MTHRCTTYRRAAAVVIVMAAMLHWGCATHRPGPDDRVLRHVIAEDESVEDLADEYYGDAGRAREIRRFNDIGRGDDPDAGTELRVPMTPDDLAALERRRAARVPYNAGLKLVRDGSYLDASVRFREAVELDPRFAQGHYNLGAAYQRMGANEKALDEFEEAASLRPKNADYRFAVGGAYFHLEKIDRAVREFRRALEIDPFHLQARYSLAVALEDAGRLDDARAEWRRYLEIDSDSAWADRARARLDALGGGKARDARESQ
jgi:tetratricopeptide (TPR) repeat protein